LNLFVFEGKLPLDIRGVLSVEITLATEALELSIEEKKCLYAFGDEHDVIGGNPCICIDDVGVALLSNRETALLPSIATKSPQLFVSIHPREQTVG
jgi:hypothetical protein